MTQANIVEVEEVETEVAEMPRLVHSKQSHDIVDSNYRQNGGGNKVLTSYFLRPDQKRIIDALADQTGETQADIVRAIFDEWCEYVLGDCYGR